MTIQDHQSWKQLLQTEYKKEYFKILSQKVDDAYLNHQILPPKELIFNAFSLCEFKDLKVVIIGQDPYHNLGQACGLSFSVNEDIKIPPSLKNIFKELSTDIQNFNLPPSGNLSSWAKQGILLLNSVLTVEANLPGSHKKFGWQQFTDSVIKLISDQKENVVFLLWGNYAISKAELIDKNKHLVLTAAHPSPLARGAFFGTKHFSKTNAYLAENKIQPITWHLT